MFEKSPVVLQLFWSSLKHQAFIDAVHIPIDLGFSSKFFLATSKICSILGLNTVCFYLPGHIEDKKLECHHSCSLDSLYDDYR